MCVCACVLALTLALDSPKYNKYGIGKKKEIQQKESLSCCLSMHARLDLSAQNKKKKEQ